MPGKTPLPTFELTPEGTIKRLEAPQPIENVVFEGGGVFGAGYWRVGQVMAQYADNKKLLNVRRYAGSSAGACFALLMALDCDWIEKFGKSFDMTKLLDLDSHELKVMQEEGRLTPELSAAVNKQKLSDTPPSKISQFFSVVKNLFVSSRHGVFKGKQLEVELELLVYRQMQRKLEAHLEKLPGSEKAKFKQFLRDRDIAGSEGNEIYPKPITFRKLELLNLYYPEIGFKELYVTGFNRSQKKLEVFSHETNPDMKLSQAVAISMCLPGIFKRKEMNENQYIDGGTKSNFPMHIFDDKKFKQKGDTSIGNPRTLGFKVDTLDEVDKFQGRKPMIKPSTKFEYRTAQWYQAVKKKVRAFFINYISNVDVAKSEREEFKYVQENHLHRVIQIKAYDLNIDRKDITDDKRRQLKFRSDQNFSSMNFKMKAEHKNLLASHGEQATKSYFEERKNQTTVVSKVYGNLKSMPEKHLRELFAYVRDTDPAVVFKNCSDGSQPLKRARYQLLVAIKEEVEKRLVLAPGKGTKKPAATVSAPKAIPPKKEAPARSEPKAASLLAQGVKTALYRR